MNQGGTVVFLIRLSNSCADVRVVTVIATAGPIVDKAE